VSSNYFWLTRRTSATCPGKKTVKREPAKPTGPVSGGVRPNPTVPRCAIALETKRLLIHLHFKNTKAERLELHLVVLVALVATALLTGAAWYERAALETGWSKRQLLAGPVDGGCKRKPFWVPASVLAIITLHQLGRRGLLRFTEYFQDNSSTDLIVHKSRIRDRSIGRLPHG
jgi:hypothetical protein